MQNIDYLSVLPEVFLLVGTCFLLLVIAFNYSGKALISSDAQLAGAAAMDADRLDNHGGQFAYRLSLVILSILTAWFFIQCDDVTRLAFHGMFVYDPLANLLKALSSLAVLVTLVYSRTYLEQRNLLRADLFALVLLSLLGQCVMISGSNLLSLYLGLELLALPSYALVAMQRHSAVTSEAAMKYFILGALASGFLLYGLSMLYGATGSLDLDEIFKTVSTGQINSLTLVFAVVFVVAGLAFKLGLAPFHMWIPDVYQGSPTAITLIIAGAPKLAGFAIMVRLLIDGLLALAMDWQQMLIILAVMSLIIGNITAIAQSNFKRMLAYSTIAHMGFMLLGLASGIVDFKVAGAVDAYGASLFYAVTYVLTTLGSFGVVLLLSRQGFEAENINDLKGLNQRSPWFAFVTLLLMFSLAGIPPTVGFYAKLAVLQAVVNAGMAWLAVAAVLLSLIAAFYYLRIVKVMYFDEPEDKHPLQASVGFRSLLSLNGALILILGLLPAGLVTICLNTMRQALAY